MSDSTTPRVPSLESLRKQAKRLLRLCRAGDAEALARLRARLPRFARLNDAAVAARLKLADVHHALARERGQESWAELKLQVEAQRPLEQQAERFLAAVRDEAFATARRLLTRHPRLPQQGLHIACVVGDAEAAADWLRRDPQSALAPHGPEAWTPLTYLCHSVFHLLDARHAEGSLRCAELLLDHGVDANTFTLFDASDPESRLSALYRTCNGNNVAVVRLLLQRGANPNDGESVYHAAERNHRACLELLLAHGTDISGRHAHWGNTPLYFLAGYKEHDPTAVTATEGMRWLLEHGADPNVGSGDLDETPLQRIAAFGRSAAVAEMLLAHGADVHRARTDGRTAHVLALRAGNDAVAQLLAGRGADSGTATQVDAFLGACMRADGAAAQALLSEHPHLLDTLTAQDRASLARAAEEGRLDSVRLMVGLGFDLRWEGDMRGTPLHHAAWRGRAEMTRLLLELGAPIDVRDGEFGSSPIGWAGHGSVHCREADDEYCAVVELLLAAGADRAASINRWGEPPESMASRKVAQLLRERGFAPAS